MERNRSGTLISKRKFKKLLKSLRLVIVAFISLTYGCLHFLPGLRFDFWVRFLAARALMNNYPEIIYKHLFLNPISSTRYFEFDFIRKHLHLLPGNIWLDISSPSLFLLWLSEKKHYNLYLINPDTRDLNQTKELTKLVKSKNQIVFEKADARNLPYADSFFDVLSSISVIEHIDHEGDSLAMKEFIRVVKPKGKIVLTFPVMGKYFEEFREREEYDLHNEKHENDLYFFQRFYDEESINSRLLISNHLRIEAIEYYYEEPVGWFDMYIKEWQLRGLNVIIKDPYYMAKYFKGPFQKHPEDRMGNCHIILEVIK